MDKKDSFCIISSDPDSLGTLLTIYYLMTVRGYNYTEASKYVIGMRFKVNLPQNFQTFLKYLFVDPKERPETPRALIEIKQNLQQKENKTPEPEFKLEDAFQTKLRKNKIKKTTGPKKSVDETNPDDIKLQKAIGK